MQYPAKSNQQLLAKAELLTMPCNGCAAKISSTVLSRVLSHLPSQQHPDIIIGLDSADDCSIIQISQDRLLVQTIDQFPSFTNDPFIFGRIVTNHCLSGLFAKGAKPHSVLATATIPYAKEEIAEEILFQVFSGAIKVLAKIGISILIGHTETGNKLAFGLSCNGMIDRDQIMTKNNLKSEQLLILTKPIGTGTILAAEMRLQAKGIWTDEMIDSMLISNQKAAEVFLDCGIETCTEITGFGLVGHLLEMLKGNNLGAELFLESIPILTGAIDTIQKNIYSSLHPGNYQKSGYITNKERFLNNPKYQLLFDPQTSGGLLGAIAIDRAEECLSLLQDNGYKTASIIGRTMIADHTSIELSN